VLQIAFWKWLWTELNIRINWDAGFFIGFIFAAFFGVVGLMLFFIPYISIPSAICVVLSVLWMMYCYYKSEVEPNEYKHS
jgi:hypothetical protein